MNVYDFDGTIIKGDSTVQFTLYCLKHYKAARKPILRAILRLPLLLSGKITLTQWKESLYRYFACVPDMQAALDSFWRENISRVYSWYKDAHAETDVVITASPEFIVARAGQMLGIAAVIGSPVDPNTGRYSGKNNNKSEKVRRYREQYGETPIERFYSDSHHDDPLAGIAKEAYFIKNGRVTPWQ